MPALWAQQQQEILGLLRDHENFTVFFDGVTRLGELFVFVARFIGLALIPTQRIFALETVKYSVDGVALAGLLQSKLQSMLAVNPDNVNHLVAITHDSASVNRAATTTLVWAYR